VGIVISVTEPSSAIVIPVPIKFKFDALDCMTVPPDWIPIEPPPPPPPEDAKVILSPLAFVVMVILLPATNVKVSVALSATTSL